MEEEYIESNDPTVDITALKRILPKWKTKVLYVTTTTTGEEKLKMLVALKTIDDIKLWLEQLQEKNMTTYFIRSTEKNTGRYVLFKQRLFCHHNPRKSLVYKKRTKNTSCPSSIAVKLRAVKKRYQGKNIENAPNSEMPCEIVLIPAHNHLIESPMALRYRRVSEETKNKLIDLYEKGHSPATALKTIKTLIHLDKSNGQSLLIDRRFCPDYDYCYYIYKKEFKNKQVLDGVDQDIHIEIEDDSQQTIEADDETCYDTAEVIKLKETRRIEGEEGSEDETEEDEEEEYASNIEIDQNGTITENISVQIDENNTNQVVPVEVDQIVEISTQQLDDDESSMTTTIGDSNEDEDAIYEYHLETGKTVIEKIATTMNEFLVDCPEKLSPALQLFYNRLETVQNRSELVSALSNFSLDYKRRKVNQVQPSTVSKRNSAISEKKRLVLNEGPENSVDNKIIKVISSHSFPKSVNNNSNLLSNEFLVFNN